jgi:hypothetical protein
MERINQTTKRRIKAMKKFICKSGSSNYYLVNDGMGGFLNPPSHPEHTYSIQEFRGGHEVGSYSLSAAIEYEWMPGAVRGTAKGVLKRWQAGEIDPAWMHSVYNYFRHSYSKDGINTNVNDRENMVTYGKFWDNAEQEQYTDPSHHLGYMYIKKFYPEHKPNLELIQNDGPLGSWSTTPKE